MEYLRVPEVAKRLNLSRATVYDYCQRGIIPSVRIGASVRVPADELEDWLKSNMRMQPPHTHASSAVRIEKS